MREIKFRGKCLDNGEWIVGSYIEAENRDRSIAHQIVPYKSGEVVREVDPATVGQYTGLTDIKGREVYEGDIINWLMHRMDRTGYIEEGRVEFRTNEQATVVINKFATRDGRESVRNILCCLNDLKVIGNIHDNPELLKGGNQ